MGFNNPDVPWRRMEAALSGRPARRADPPSANSGGNDDARDAAVREDAPISRKRRDYTPGLIQRRHPATRYAELHAHTSYSFLDGASEPDQLVAEASRLGLAAIAVTDSPCRCNSSIIMASPSRIISAASRRRSSRRFWRCPMSRG